MHNHGEIFSFIATSLKLLAFSYLLKQNKMSFYYKTIKEQPPRSLSHEDIFDDRLMIGFK